MVNLPLDRVGAGRLDDRPQTERLAIRSDPPRSAKKDDNAPSSDAVYVFARFRPQSVSEEQEGGKLSCFFDSDGRTVSVSGERGLSTFRFTKVFQPEATQSEVYSQVGQPVVHKCLNGINSAIVAYGQTGSGKTHSMIGSFAGAWNDEVEQRNELEGIIPRTLRDLFFAIANAPAHIDYRVCVSLVEIYQENITDLLTPESKGNFLTIREDRRRRLFITDAAQFPVESARDVLALIHRGMRARETSRTKMNERSSRSHAVVILNIEKRDGIEASLTTSQLYMVDLAGSEVVAKTEAKGQVLEEAKSINASLFALGRVISALAEGAAHVPYRDSKLTRLLQHCFGGSSSTALIVNCSPSSFNRQETVATLQLGARSQTIMNKVVVDKVHTSRELERMLREARSVIERQGGQLRTQQREMELLRQEAALLRAQLQARPASEAVPTASAPVATAQDGGEPPRRRSESETPADSESERGEGGGGSDGGRACEDGTIGPFLEGGERVGEEEQRAGGGESGGGVVGAAARAARRLEEEPWCEPRFLCPVSGRLMRNPAVLADGNTYDESVARRYVSGPYAADPRSPLTGVRLAHTHVTPNTLVRMLIQRSCPFNLDSIPPAVSLILFPPQIELLLLALLDCRALGRVACTCRHLRAAADQDELWHALLLAHTPALQVKETDLFGQLFKAQLQTLLAARRLTPAQAANRHRKMLPSPSSTRGGITLQPANVA